MKKTTLILIMVAATVISCTKEAGVDPANGNHNSSQPLLMVSAWFPATFSAVTANADTWLEALEPHSAATGGGYEKSKYVELAFVKLPGTAQVYEYKRLPLDLTDPSGNSADIFSFSYSISDAGFLLKLENSSRPAMLPATAIFKDLTYRFLVVPRSTYDVMNIDWNDYLQVCQSLAVNP